MGKTQQNLGSLLCFYYLRKKGTFIVESKSHQGSKDKENETGHIFRCNISQVRQIIA